METINYLSVYEQERWKRSGRRMNLGCAFQEWKQQQRKKNRVSGFALQKFTIYLLTFLLNPLRNYFAVPCDRHDNDQSERAKDVSHVNVKRWFPCCTQIYRKESPNNFDVIDQGPRETCLCGGQFPVVELPLILYVLNGKEIINSNIYPSSSSETWGNLPHLFKIHRFKIGPRGCMEEKEEDESN